METVVYQLRDFKLSPLEFESLTALLKSGKVIVFPAETVYALGCLFSNEAGKQEIFNLKNRTPDKKLPLMFESADKIESFLGYKFSSLAEKVTGKFMPGPVTIILPIENKEDSFAFRVPDHEFVKDLISACGQPLAATSANLSNEEPAVNFNQARKIFFNKVSAMVDGGAVCFNKPSTIIDLKDKDNFRVVREGVYEENLIKAALNDPKNILLICTGNSCRSIMAAAILKKELKERKIEGVEVSSAGTSAVEGMPASREAVRVMEELGAENQASGAKRLNEEMLRKADLILTMEKRHRDYILDINVQLKYKVFQFMKFSFGLEEEVRDPIGQGLEEYRQTSELFKRAAREIVKKIS